MEKINSESIITSLFLLGFDQVDCLLYTYTLGKIATDTNFLEMFEFEDKEKSLIFNKFIEYDGIKFMFKKGYNIYTIISLKPNQDTELPLYKALNINDKLVEYLKNVDFKQIIVQKIISLGVNRINDYDNLFSDYERGIISEMFQIDEMHKKFARKQGQIYDNMIREEERATEKMLTYLDIITKHKK